MAEASLELSARDGDPRRAVAGVCDYGRDADGWPAQTWATPATRPADSALLINQASVARALWRAAWPMPTTRPAR